MIQASSRVFFCALLIIAAASTPAVAQNSLEEGKKWYNQRAAEADSFIAEPKYINNAIEAFRESIQNDMHHEESAVYLLRSYYFKGMYLELSEEEQKDIFEQGRQLGEEMAQRYPKSVPIKFWYGANLGQWARFHGFLAAATNGSAKTLRSLSEEMIKLDPDFQGGGGYRILAQVHFYTPKIPLIMGWPSDEKALNLIKKAMEIAPEHPSNQILFAELLLKFGRKSEAKQHLNSLITMEPRPTNLVEDRYVKYRARMLMKEYYGQT